MKKRNLLLTVALVSAILAGCGGNKENPSDNQSGMAVGSDVEFPLKEKVTYQVAQRRGGTIRSFSEMEAWNKYYEDKSNIHIDWLDWGDEGAYNQKLQLAVASGDLPDAFYGGFLFSPQEYVKYGSSNIIIPIEDMIDTYMPNYKRLYETMPSLKDGMIANGGHIYGVPSYLGVNSGEARTNDVILYNREWMEKLGLKMPETPEEFYEYLKAIKAAGDLNGNGKNDEIPFTFHFGTGGTIDHINGLSSFVGFSGAMLPANYFYAEDGKINFAPTNPKIKEAIAFLNKLNNENLIDKEAFTMDSNTYSAKIRTPESIAGVLIGWSENNINTIAGDNKYVYGLPLKDKDGNRRWQERVRPVSATISFAITNKAKNPELLLKWADLHLDVDASVYNYIGEFDKHVKKYEDGTYEQLTDENGKMFEATTILTPQNFSLSILLPEDAVFRSVPVHTVSKNAANDVYCQFVDPEYFFDVYNTEEEVEENAIIGNDVRNYVTKMIAKWIYSGGIEEEWDTYIKELEKMKLNDWTENMQAAYDRSK